MNKQQLLELTSDVTTLIEDGIPIIVGSHSLYALTDSVPEIVRRSIEADFLLAAWGSEVMKAVDKELGFRSSYFETKGFYADSLGLATVVLVPGWQERLQPLVGEDGQVVARCLEVHDAAVSKLIAGREKDFIFIVCLLEGRYIEFPTLIERAALIQQTASAGALLPRLKLLEEHLRRAHLMLDLTPLRNLIRQLSV